MSTIIATVAQGVTAEGILPPEQAATLAAEGKVKFHRERANGTTRRIKFLAEGTREREVAEWVQAQRDEGRTMKAIAADMHVSVPSVRRMLNALLLAQDVEDGDFEVEVLEGATEGAPATESAPTPAPDPAPTQDQAPAIEAPRVSLVKIAA